jgi:hypothetical protein
VCAGGENVLSAGGVTFGVEGAEVTVTEVTNQSTGYRPEPESRPYVEEALDKAGPGADAKESGHKPFYTRDRHLAIVRWNGRKIGLYGHGHYLIRCEQTVYMAPALLLHYILHHRYKPPDQFVKAVIEGRILAADDLLFKPIRSSLTFDEVEVDVDGIRFGMLRRF